MENAKNIRWIIPLKKFSMVRVNVQKFYFLEKKFNFVFSHFLDR